MPVVRKEREKDEFKDAQQLENYRSDDLPDVDNGLSSFYKKMKEILDKSTPPILKDMIIAAYNKSRFKPREEKDFFELLKEDNLRFLDALDEYEEQFGENQKIKALKRCNQRIIWVEPGRSEGCKMCIEAERGSQATFNDLLKCKAVTGAVESLKNNLKNSWQSTAFENMVFNADNNVFEFTSESRFLRSDLKDHDYQNIMSNAEEEFTTHLASLSRHLPAKATLHFVGLQRWNSLTPAQGRSVGGGYFIYHTDAKGVVDLGIAIDPGFDFVRNLFRNGFSLRDIDIVLISHTHADHVWDFESIVQLLHELDGKKKIKKRISVILSLGIYQRLQHIITSQELRQFMDPLVIDIAKEVDPHFFENLGADERYRYQFIQAPEETNQVSRWKSVLPGINGDVDHPAASPLVEVWPTRAYHDDDSQKSDSFGFKINFKNFGTNIKIPAEDLCFGYTGDTKWVGDDLYNQGCPLQTHPTNSQSTHQHKGGLLWQEVASEYGKCDVILIHVGSLIDHKHGAKFEDYAKADQCEKLIRKEKHLYLMGLIRFLTSLCSKNNKENESKSSKLILIGEFGEELRGGIRTDITTRLQYGIRGAPPILPVDVGLDILLEEESDEKGSPKGKNGYRFMCAICEKDHPIKDIEYHRFGHDEAIFYLCRTCFRATPSDVIQIKLQQLYEVGKELRN